jgi:DMSO/TMAO reductase YedYZ molybdopterin-dependent catalytic subunit
VGFFERNRQALIDRGIDPARLPPGQYSTERFPVLHIGEVPEYEADLSNWDLRIFGAVDRPYVLTWEELLALPSVEVTQDIHCVTKWTMLDTVWKGVLVRDLFDRAGVHADAAHVVEHADFGYTTNVPLPDIVTSGMVAYEFGGAPLAPEHGFPARVVIPHLYFWKSAKWLRGLEVTVQDQPGFWEVNGYHNYADPFREQRYSG